MNKEKLLEYIEDRLNHNLKQRDNCELHEEKKRDWYHSKICELLCLKDKIERHKFE